VYDKVIGLAAAKILVYHGINEAHAGTISTMAINYLNENGIKITFDKQVERIMNKKKDGLCPLEEKALNLDEEDFMKELERLF